MEASAVQLGQAATRAPQAPRMLLRLRSDEQLLALFRAGSDEAFQMLHDRYRVRLLAYVRRMLPPGARSDAEDALQDVFIRAYGALRADERPVAVRAWLYRVAHNRCVDALRRPAPTPVEGAEREGDARHDPCDEAERREALELLVLDLQRLPEAQRSCLLLRELEGLSYAELGVVLNATQPAVKSLLVRARMGLADAAEARGADCRDIRADLAASCERGVRMSSRARLHLRDCESCSAYHGILRRTQRQLAGLAPQAGPLAGLLRLAGLGGGGAAAGGSALGGGTAGGATLAGFAGSSVAAKVAVVVCVAVGTGSAVRAAERPSPRPGAHSQAVAAPVARPAAVARAVPEGARAGGAAAAARKAPVQAPAPRPRPAAPAATEPEPQVTGGAPAPDEPVVAATPAVTLEESAGATADGLSTGTADPAPPTAEAGSVDGAGVVPAHAGSPGASGSGGSASSDPAVGDAPVAAPGPGAVAAPATP